MKQKGLLALAFLFSFTLAWGQSRQVTGHVTKENSNDPVPGVTVAVKGTKTATSTDNSGN
jgi:TonB-dependent starch-binding outer membrane protein SusC